MTRRIASFILIVIATSAGLVHAQAPARGRGMGPGMGAPRFAALFEQIVQAADSVNPTAEQRVKIDAIIEASRQEFRAIAQELNQAQADQPARRQRFTPLFAAVQGKIRPVLNSEQVAIFDRNLGELWQASPATQPSELPATPPRIGVVLERLHDYLFQLDLNDEQKAHIEQLFTETRGKLREMAQQADAGQVQARSQAIIQQMRQQLPSILTSQQLEKMRQLIAQGGPLAQQSPREMMDGPMMNPPAAPANTAPTVQTPVELPLIDVGKAAPTFSLKKIEGQTVDLPSFNGKLVLVVFGSYSSPSFRQRAGALEELKRSYSVRLNSVLIYTRENYPTGQWDVDRNKSEGVSVEQPATLDERMTLAKQARTALKLTGPILIDTLDDATAKAYGGDTNAAYLIGRDGTVLARQRWFEPYAMRRAIDEALKEGQK